MERQANKFRWTITREHIYHDCKMIIVIFLVAINTGYSTTNSFISGTRIEIKYFARNYLPTGISIDSITAKSILACASLCRPKNCTSLFYDDGTRWCKINEDSVSFPAGTTFQSQTADYIRFIEFKEVIISFLFDLYHSLDKFRKKMMVMT